MWCNSLPIALLLPLSLASGCRGPGSESHPPAGVDPVPVDRAAALRDVGEQRADAAQLALWELQRRMDGNEPLTPEFLESMFSWSRRLRDARADVAGSAHGRVESARWHLDFCLALASVMFDTRRGDVGTYPKALCEYEVADARYVLGQVGGDPSASPSTRPVVQLPLPRDRRRTP